MMGHGIDGNPPARSQSNRAGSPATRRAIGAGRHIPLGIDHHEFALIKGPSSGEQGRRSVTEGHGDHSGNFRELTGNRKLEQIVGRQHAYVAVTRFAPSVAAQIDSQSRTVQSRHRDNDVHRSRVVESNEARS